MRQGQGCAIPLGTSTYGKNVNFSVSVPHGKKCELLLYNKGEETPVYTFEMHEKKAIGTIRFLELKNIDYTEYEYNYKIDDEIVTDIYAKELKGKGAFGSEKVFRPHQIRSAIAGKPYDWHGDKPLRIAYHNVVAYSIHVRGFTKHASSKIKHKGTFAGVIEKIPYLKELGINQIQCMPVYEFEECQKRHTNYWGYGEGYYFSPKSSYAASDSSINELKDMVRMCHKSGIEVVLDFPFTSNTRGQFIEDCLQYYVMEYHIDGFILNPLNAPMDSLRTNPILAETKLLKKEDGFQNVMRRFLKGDEGMIHDVMWALRHNGKDDGSFNYITNHTGFTLQDLVSYDGKHNESNGEQNHDGPEYNYSWNCGAEGPSRKKSVVELRRKQVRNAFFLLLSAQGMPCILAGDEFENSQKGNNNVYCQDNETGWLNWGRLNTESGLFLYVKALISFRKKHPLLHRENELLGMDQISCGIPDVSYHGENAWQTPSEIASRQLGILYRGETVDDNDCFVIYNMHWLKHTFALPTLRDGKKWYQVMDTAQGVFQRMKLLKNQKEIELDERTTTLLIGK